MPKKVKRAKTGVKKKVVKKRVVKKKQAGKGPKMDMLKKLARGTAGLAGSAVKGVAKGTLTGAKIVAGALLLDAAVSLPGYLAMRQISKDWNKKK